MLGGEAIIALSLVFGGCTAVGSRQGQSVEGVSQCPGGGIIHKEQKHHSLLYVLALVAKRLQRLATLTVSDVCLFLQHARCGFVIGLSSQMIPRY